MAEGSRKSARILTAIPISVLVLIGIGAAVPRLDLWAPVSAFRSKASAVQPLESPKYDEAGQDLESDDPLWFERQLLNRTHFRHSTNQSRALLHLQTHSRGDLDGAVDTEALHWLLVEEHAGFSPRYAHSSIIDMWMNIFVIGGATADVDASALDGTRCYLNDVWSSSDKGHTWTQISSEKYPKRFKPRRGHVAVMDSEGVIMFVMGGFCGNSCEERYLNDWWSSTGGDIWHDMNLFIPAKWSPRHGHAAIMTSHDNLIILGGHDGKQYLNDIWHVRDPSQAHVWNGQWELVDASAPWHPRYGHAVVINTMDSIFLIGGFFADKASGRVVCFNDVWRSENQGSDWYVSTAGAPWKGRYQHTAVINTKDEIFVVGGLDVDLQRCSDSWRSQDSGQTWTLVSEVAAWTARYEHTAVVDEHDSLYVIGGMSTGDEKFNDIWRSERTCHDNIKCANDSMICRDGTDENFKGMPNPICVDICDERIFDNCTVKEACEVHHHKATCVDPCEDTDCGKTDVCEVMPRGTNAPHADKPLATATAYCLSCGHAKTKFACDKLRQCTWSVGDEACLTRCSVRDTEDACKAEKDTSGSGRCKWKHNACDNA